MNTSKWGPAAWLFLHSTAYNYPTNPTPQQRDHMRAFFSSVGNIFPCKYCRASFRSFLTHQPLTDAVLANHHSLNVWLWQMHNRVNKKLGKRFISFEEMRTQMERIRVK